MNNQNRKNGKKGSTSALGEFGGVFSDIKRLWGWAAGAATVPFLANFANLAPPWPPSLPYLTAMFEILVLIWVYHNLKNTSKRTITNFINFGIPALFVLVIIYLFIVSSFTFNIAGTNLVGIRGYQCTEIAIQNYGVECPLIKPDNIAKAEWDSTVLWTGASIAAVRISLVAIWLLLFVILTSILGAFVVRQHDLSRRRKPN